jgi:hypothetical protein
MTYHPNDDYWVWLELFILALSPIYIITVGVVIELRQRKREKEIKSHFPPKSDIPYN